MKFSLSGLPLFFIIFPAFAQRPEGAEFFEKNIRPIFATRCSPCHNQKLKTAGLDLSTPAGIAAGADSGPILSKDKPPDSRLLKVVGYTEKLKMPPDAKLPDTMLGDLATWVNSGAPLPEYKAVSVSKPDTGVFSDARRKHWSFQPVRDFAPPAVKHTDWVQSPIDQFILAKLEQKGIEQPKKADKLTLIRRAKYDLLGLPPNEQEIRDFLADNSNDALAKVVDRFLASPHYGEKWGRHWLDVARYAETSGVDENEAYAEAWRYREYVIDAFNRDKPYDRMVREQIAGDLLTDEDGSEVNVRGRIATGFLALGPKATVEMDKVKTTYDVIDEQIDTTSKAFLGLTVACARCHDHKFDPIATTDYYSMAAIFANTQSFERTQGDDFFVQRHSKMYLAPLVRQEIYENYKAHQQKIAVKKMEAAALLDTEIWKYSVENLFPRIADYMVAAWNIQRGKSRLEDIADAEKLDTKMLQGWVKYLDPKGGFRPHLKRWQEANESSVNAIAREYSELFQKTARNWAILLLQWKAATESAVRGEGDLPKAPNIEYNSKTAFTDPSERLFADIVIPAKTLNDKSSKDGPFVIPEKEQEKLLAAPVKEQLAALHTQSDALEKSSPPKPLMANAVAEGPKVEQKVFIRGNYSSLGDPVAPDVPLILRTATTNPVTQGSGRKELADFLANPANPLTARVMVNRIWLWHFGDGLVRTPNNFGLMGEPPTHPELLDFLARKFVESGWSIKSMHRMLMLSSLYQSSSEITAQAFKADPANALWSRFERRRMTVEEMRDTWLQLSNVLDLRMGGIFDQVDAPAAGRGAGMRGQSPRSFEISKRRTVYVAVNRAAVPTPMVLNDFVDSTTSAGDRPETIIAPQALYLMNNPFVAKNATAFAGRLLADQALTDEQRVQKAYWMAWDRQPSDAEMESALAYIRKYPVSEKSDFGAWQSFCRILMSANQFYYIE